jgi:hypothetical protein
MKPNSFLLCTILTIGTLLLGACSILNRPAAPSVTPTAADGALPAGVTTVPGPVGTAVQTGTAPPPPCPTPMDTQQLYDGSGPGFCFLYPSDFYLYPGAAVILIGPPHALGTTSVSGTLTITSEILSAEDLQQYAAQLTGGSGQPAPQALVVGSGYPAMLVDEISGQVKRRDLLIEHAGRVYQISFQPWDDATPDARGDLQRIYASLVESWVFMK